MTFLVLVGAWEAVLRQRSGAAVDFAIARPKGGPPAKVEKGDDWLLFGNCLVMTGISPRGLGEQLGDDPARTIVNIASHEQSPLAYFDYLKQTGAYPRVAIANVSSWLNGTNFEQEAAQVAKEDPLGRRAVAGTSNAGARPPAAGDEAPQPPPTTHEQAFKKDGESAGALQRHTEAALAHVASEHLRAVGKRYHLFDYSLFLGTLATTANLDSALYQLNMQSWFKVRGSETDGQGYVGILVDYRGDWDAGLERMAERSLQRMRLSRLLTPRYWALFRDGVKDLQAHGTQVVVVRMPEHPKIRAFNDERYELPTRLREVETETGAQVLDLSHLGPAEGVRLFDAVHPDAAGAEVITRAVATWLRDRHLTAGPRPAGQPGGG